MNISRRGFIASIAAGIGGIGAGTGYRNLIPFVIPANDITPGVATWYASTCRECPAGCGMLLRNREAHVVKAEGNPRSPVCSGKLCARGQASLLGLYDPDRIPWPRLRRKPDAPWLAVAQPEPKNPAAATGDGGWAQLYPVLGRTLAGARHIGFISDLQSGSMAELIRQWLTALSPRATADDYLVFEPLNYEPLRVANEKLFGRAEIPDYRLDRCDFLVSFGADFLETWLSPVQLSRRFTQMRAVKDGRRAGFIYVGSRRSPTAAMADKVILVPPGQEGLVALAMLHAMGEQVPAEYAPENVAKALSLNPKELQWLADQYRPARSPLALAGDPLPAGEEANANALAANLLNRFHPTEAIDWSRPHALSHTATMAQTQAFLNRAHAGEYDVIVILNANPVYALPPELKAKEALAKARTVICLNTMMDETVAAVGTWALPINAPAESWGDYSPAAGIHSLMQPAVGCYFQSRDAADVLLRLARAAGVSAPGWPAFPAEEPEGYSPSYEYLRSRWRKLQQAAGDTGDFEAFWRKSVQHGGLTLPAPPPPAALALGHIEVPKLPLAKPGGVRLALTPSLHFYDGRHANKMWLQEIPDPMTHAVWGSWVELAPQTATPLGVRTGDLVTVSAGAASVELPAHLRDDVAPGTAAIALGQGHNSYGRFAEKVGVNAFVLLGARGAPPEVRIARASGDGKHVVAHGEQDQHGREIALTVPVADAAHAEQEPLNLPTPAGYVKTRDIYAPHPHPLHRWAMAVDLDRCTGCNACVAACYSENNLTAVGKEEVARRHEMPWIRIDRWDEGYGANKRSIFQPLMCQQCEAAPCEPVCPAYATMHSAEGLNEQVYNRCIGTRYCSNNCPYKARRFNWFHYDVPEPLTYQLNPDVTVRDRGVMEKCTFCVQRIKEVTIRAKAEGRAVKDGDIVPACAQTCPADAFLFGDLNDPNSRLSRLVQEDRRRYQVLRELNTKPAVFYQKRIV